MEPNRFRKQFAGIEDACALAQDIVDTVREPVLALGKDLRVIAASRSFYSVFNVNPQDTQAQLLIPIPSRGGGQFVTTSNFATRTGFRHTDRSALAP
jgi:hypothetical protein